MTANARYLLLLEGGGDVYVTLVTKEYWDWIRRHDTPGRENGASGWIDTAAPAALVEAHRKCEEWPGQDKFEGLFVTSGSYENDRALHASVVDDVEGIDRFDAVTEAIAFAKQHALDIVDEYHGYIY